MPACHQHGSIAMGAPPLGVPLPAHVCWPQHVSSPLAASRDRTTTMVQAFRGAVDGGARFGEGFGQVPRTRRAKQQELITARWHTSHGILSSPNSGMQSF
jgi:hypothetical protein